MILRRLLPAMNITDAVSLSIFSVGFASVSTILTYPIAYNTKWQELIIRKQSTMRRTGYCGRPM